MNKKRERPKDSGVIGNKMSEKERKFARTYEDYSKLLKMMRSNPKKF